jgi:hypothetical protein
MRAISTLFILVLLGFTSCKKNNQLNCQQLKTAAYTDDINTVRSIITAYIAGLPSQVYSEENIQLLTERISKCDIVSSMLCFDCIKTLPAQTEITLSFVYNGSTVNKVIDLSYSANNKIVFHNLHN